MMVALESDSLQGVGGPDLEGGEDIDISYHRI